MARAKPFCREAGSGTTVLCLHSSLGSSAQWRALMERLCTRYRVVTPDLYGYGRSPQWTGGRKLSLEDEVALLEPVIDSIDGSFHVVGHSYGGAVASRLAMLHASRVESLTLFEPVLFSLLQRDDAEQPAAREAASIGDCVRQGVREQSFEPAARRFIDYWSGDGAWQAMPDGLRAKLLERLPKLVCDFDTALTDSVPLEHYSALRMPVQLLRGASTPMSTRRIFDLLRAALPSAKAVTLPDIGHMGPVTHPQRVNSLIETFVDRCERAQTQVAA